MMLRVVAKNCHSRRHTFWRAFNHDTRTSSERASSERGTYLDGDRVIPTVTTAAIGRPVVEA
jgi:hypothetical protein